jgi:hypothetical protein
VFQAVLGGHVLGGSDLRREVAATHQLRKAKVAELNCGWRLAVEEDVVKLDVSMCYVLFVAVVDGTDDLLHKVHRRKLVTSACVSGHNGWETEPCDIVM